MNHNQRIILPIINSFDSKDAEMLSSLSDRMLSRIVALEFKSYIDYLYACDDDKIEAITERAFEKIIHIREVDRIKNKSTNHTIKNALGDMFPDIDSEEGFDWTL